MRKKTLAILTLISLGLFFVGIATIAVMTAATAVYCSSPNCPPPSAPPIGLIVSYIIGNVLILAAGVLHISAWIGAMITQVKRQQWTWFVCTFLFSPICTWIYLVAVSESPEPMVPIYMQPEQPVYQPYTQGYGVPQPANAQPGVYQEGRQQYQYLEQQQDQQQYEDLMVMYPQEQNIL